MTGEEGIDAVADRLQAEESDEISVLQPTSEQESATGLVEIQRRPSMCTVSAPIAITVRIVSAPAGTNLDNS